MPSIQNYDVLQVVLDLHYQTPKGFDNVGGYQIAAPGNWVMPSVRLSVRPSEANRLPNYKRSGAKLDIF